MATDRTGSVRSGVAALLRAGVVWACAGLFAAGASATWWAPMPVSHHLEWTAVAVSCLLLLPVTAMGVRPPSARGRILDRPDLEPRCLEVRLSRAQQGWAVVWMLSVDLTAVPLLVSDWSSWGWLVVVTLPTIFVPDAVLAIRRAPRFRLDHAGVHLRGTSADVFIAWDNLAGTAFRAHAGRVVFVVTAQHRETGYRRVGRRLVVLLGRRSRPLGGASCACELVNRIPRVVNLAAFIDTVAQEPASARERFIGPTGLRLLSGPDSWRRPEPWLAIDGSDPSVV